MFLKHKRLLLCLYRLEETQQQILQRLDALERRAPSGTEQNDRWLRQGIDSILSFKAKGGEVEQ